MDDAIVTYEFITNAYPVGNIHSLTHTHTRTPESRLNYSSGLLLLAAEAFCSQFPAGSTFLDNSMEFPDQFQCSLNDRFAVIERTELRFECGLCDYRP